MKTVNVSVCRVYQVGGRIPQLPKAFSLEIDFGNIEVTAAITSETRHPAPVDLPMPAPGTLYCEIESVIALNIGDDLADSFFRYDLKAKAEIFKIAAKKKMHYLSSLDYVAGRIGLQYGNSLVRTLLAEQSYAYYDKRSATTNGSADIHQMDPGIRNNKSRVDADLNDGTGGIFNGLSWRKKSEILGWLQAAWRTTDRTEKFVSFIFVLERSIPKTIPKGNINIWNQNLKNVLFLIEHHAVSEDRQQLIEFAKGLKQVNVQGSRLENWLVEIALPGWKSDLSAFRRFAGIRNELVKSAKAGQKPQSVIRSSDMLTLEALTEKYLRFALFE